jgi:outer membrane receptor protein involved in Fe transport
MKTRHAVPARAGIGMLAATISAILGSTTIANVSNAQESLEEVVVTGSRIARRDFDANSPIMTIDAERFEASSTIAIESVINQLPQFVPAITQFDSGNYDQGADETPGAASLSLRGLGANRNLVLLDGRRAMPVNATMAVSINTIPSAAIERVETITGGASSVYGADAIAGVVNFILKRDFEGVDFDFQYGQTAEGDGHETRFSGIFGANFAAGNGNVLLGFERSERGEIRETDREFYRNGWADPWVEGDEDFLSPTAFSANGNAVSRAAVDSVFSERAPGTVGLGSNFYLNPDGTLYKQQADGSYRYNGPTYDAEGNVLRKIEAATGELGQNQTYRLMSIPLERYSLFSRAHLDFSSRVSAFAQAMFSESSTRAVGTDSPLLGGWRSSAPHGSGIYAPSVDGDGNTLADYMAGGRFGLNCGPVGGCTDSEAFPTPPELTTLLDSRTDPNGDWEFRHSTTWAGPRRSYVDTTSYQIVTGLEGDFADRDWTWELYASHGNTRTAGEYGGMVSLSRWRFVTGQPNYGRGLFYTGNELGAGFSSGTVTCETGMPIVNEFVPSADCQAAIFATAKTTGDMEQDIFEFNLQGGLFAMPAGDLRFAVGSSWRENTYQFLADTLNSQESFLDLAAGIFPSSNSIGTTTVSEIYGELLVPLLADKTGAQALNLELGYRKSNNSPSEDVDTHKALLDWSITDRVRFRGGRQVANRAPNIGELFLARQQEVGTSQLGDWCSENNPTNPQSANPALNPNAAQVRAICEARMGATGAANWYDPSNLQATGAFSWRFANVIGNPNLTSESAETITAGFVSDINDRTTLTVDYWEIEIRDMIAAQSGDAVYTQCMSPVTNPSFDPNHPACLLIVRDPSNGGQAPVDVSYTNEGAINTAGVDMQLDWNGDLGQGMISVNFLASVLNKVETRIDPESQWQDWKGTSGPNDLNGIQGGAFDYRTFTTVSYGAGPWSMSLRWRHLPGLASEASLQDPNDTSVPTGSYNMFDVSGRYRIHDNWQLRYGIDNLLDAEPERWFADADTTANGMTNPDFYDVLGRRYYMGLSIEF